MEIDIKHVHVGRAIEERRAQLEISKSELGRRIGVPQQHVNRILERETMETSRLIKVSEVLDYNFFSLFCSVPQQISAYLAAVTLKGDANNNIGDSALAAQLTKGQDDIVHLKDKITLLEEYIKSLKTQIERLDRNLKDKDDIIELLRKGGDK